MGKQRTKTRLTVLCGQTDDASVDDKVTEVLGYNFNTVLLEVDIFESDLEANPDTAAVVLRFSPPVMGYDQIKSCLSVISDKKLKIPVIIITDKDFDLMEFEDFDDMCIKLSPGWEQGYPNLVGTVTEAIEEAATVEVE